MYKLSNIDYKLEGLKYVRNMLAEKDTIIAYSERCNPDPYAHKRKCNWSYATLEYNMSDYPCPWDKYLISKCKNKTEQYSTKGCFHRCFLKDSRIKESTIINKKKTYVDAMDKLISIMENGEDWQTILSKTTLVHKKANNSKQKDNKSIKEDKYNKTFNSIREINNINYLEHSLADIATDIIKFAKSNDIHVLRYDSKSSNSIYLKFDYGMAGSLRLSDTQSTNDLRHTFNLLSCIDKPYKDSCFNEDKNSTMFYYPISMTQNVMIDIVRFKEFRKSKYGPQKYKALFDKYKENREEKIGFWKKASQV